ncbi:MULTISPECIES: hypothetical protein [Streptomyces]|uniref:GNAT family N-acetyltransferase n=1 Tax=Streptomyces doudnae TaxID=3075536 RepID=A0ABD5EP66_9ACTN|nr:MULTISPECIES: hypothetical protein [unclassified Streptomyces]MDT0435635.1 hypothetical protein [Streptomyces sp. DSM 41981]MYQ62589.1 hypothetical protein [Streptomyces sp. SID4950]SCD40407.1 hypothetical protein GA0115242_104894 [Streptomyces sp. SolWspMP-5a-2]
MAREPRPRRERAFLPGIADIRITADEATTRAVLAVLEASFHTTDPRPYDGGRTYLQLDAGNTAPDD